MGVGDKGAFTLVLGGGGLSGIAWMTGLIAGLADGGVDLASAGRIIGTSAGSTVAAQLSSGLSTEELFARQTDPALQPAEMMPSMAQLMTFLRGFQACLAIPDPVERRQRLCALAVDSETASEPERRAIIAGRLPLHDWPGQRLELTAVEVATGKPCVFDAHAGIGLVDAVAASCAVPGVWPPVTISGQRYVDGGLRSADNADLAIGDDIVVILSPIGGVTVGDGPSSLAREVAALEGSGATVITIEPDSEARSAMGTNALDPSIRAAAAQAGRHQGQREASRLAGLLSRR